MSLTHPLAAEDAPVVAAMAQATLAHKGEPLPVEARPMFDAMIAATPDAEGIRFEQGVVGGIAGWWCRPERAAPGRHLLYVHGGGYGFGSANAFRHFASHLAVRAKANAFLPDYRLAPEHPFPAALDDVVAAYRGLVAQGAQKVVAAGDSAGGGLVLALTEILRGEARPGRRQARSAHVAALRDTGQLAADPHRRRRLRGVAG